MLLTLLCACKAEIGGGNSADPDANDVDAPDVVVPDAPGTFGPWSTPLLLPGASTAASEDDGTLSNSKLEVVFSKADPAIDGGRKHLYWASRPSVTSMQWSTPVRLAFNLDGTSDETPRFSGDDKTLYFASSRAPTTGGLDIWMVTRTTVGTSGGWSAPAVVTNVNSAQTDKWCMPCSTGRYLMVSGRNNPTTPNDDIYEGVTGGGQPTLVTQLSDLANTDNGPFMSADCKTMYFASNRSGTTRIYTAARTTANGTWDAPQLLPDFANIGMAQEDPWLSDDGKTFMFSVLTAAGNKDVYITTR